MRGVAALGEVIAEEAERKLAAENDPARALAELEVARASGEIGEEEAEELEAQLIEELLAARGPRPEGSEVHAVEIVRQAKEQVAELTGLKVEGATGFERNGDGWLVTVVALELSRTPNTMDVLGVYEVVLGDDGDLQQFKRTRRTHRAAVEEGMR